MSERAAPSPAASARRMAGRPLRDRIFAVGRGVGISGRGLVIAIPYIWLLLLFAAPFVIVAKISVSQQQQAQPPYTPLVQMVEEGSVKPPGQDDPVAVQKGIFIQASLDNFAFLLDDSLYYSSYLNSLKIAAISTIFCLLLGFPIAYGVARSPPAWRNALLMLIILPFWTSFLIRVYAWVGILKNNGVINNLLTWLGVINQPIPMMNTDFAVYVGIVYSYLPFMILPLYANLEKLDLTLLEAAADLGCRPWKAFLKITLPLSLSGVIAGSMLVFIPAVGEYVIPELLGGPDSLMIGRVLWNEFFANRDWPVASAVAIAILLLLVGPIMFFQYFQARQAEAAT
jgi:putrescine transport system permease protein